MLLHAHLRKPYFSVPLTMKWLGEASRGVKGAGQPRGQLSDGDAGGDAGAGGGGLFLWAPLHVPATRAPTGPCQGDNKEDKARFPV